MKIVQKVYDKCRASNILHISRNVIIIEHLRTSERFFSKAKSKLIAFVSKNSSELRRTTIKNCNFSLLLILQLLENLIPIRTTSICSSFQACDKISFLLIKNTTMITNDWYQNITVSKILKY